MSGSVRCFIFCVLLVVLALPAYSTLFVPPVVSADNYPVINGSTSTIPLGDLLRSRILGLPGELRRLPYVGEHSVILTFPLQMDVDKIADYNQAADRSRHQGTHQAYMRLIAEKRTTSDTGPAIGSLGPMPLDPDPVGPQADLILVARKPSEDELKAAKEKGVEFDVRPVALDAFVFLVNSKNHVQSLTLSQIKSIYTGTTTNWKDVGGKDEAIKAFTRDRNSGSQELMEKLVMKGAPMIQGEENMVMTMGGVIDRVSTTPNGIAYSVYYYEHIMNQNLNNRLLAVNGVYPALGTIASRNYPLTAEVYAVTRKGMDKDSAAVKIRDWLLSDAGQRLVAESGYVPIHPVKR